MSSEAEGDEVPSPSSGAAPVPPSLLAPGSLAALGKHYIYNS